MTQIESIGIEFELVQSIDPSDEEKPSKRLQNIHKNSQNKANNINCAYNVQWCPYPGFAHYFAVVGGFQRNSASIYKLSNVEYQNNNNNNNYEEQVSLVHTYVDLDEEEDFYCCCWGLAVDKSLVLSIAGYHGVIKGMNASNLHVQYLLPGHLSEINELKIIPNNPALLLSAAKDESIRLWNTHTNVCVAMFSGRKGHRQHVLTIDVHPLSNCFVSAGHDFSVKVWSLADPLLQQIIELSGSYKKRRVPDDEHMSFPTYSQTQPLFSTDNTTQGRLHGMTYIDCVRWYGDFVISRSSDNQVLMWAPDAQRKAGAANILREFKCPGEVCWFTKFAICPQLDLLAVGNHAGKVFIHSISGDIPGVPVEDGIVAEPTAPAGSGTIDSGEGTDVPAVVHKQQYYKAKTLPVDKINKVN